MGTDDQARERLAAVLATDLPVLVDADGLTLLAADRGLLDRAAPTLLTPHAGELGRLLRVDPADVEERRLEHAKRAAAELGATVLLKGSTTVIAPADGRSAPGGSAARPAHDGDALPGDAGPAPLFVNSTGTSWLATAGTGDVLSGLAGALLAQGLAVGDAAAVAAYLHGLAARQAARGSGERPAPAVPLPPACPDPGVTGPGAEAPIAAADVIGALPGAIRSVRGWADPGARGPGIRLGSAAGAGTLGRHEGSCGSTG
jgi:NAD(P)H-hydrate repair Nnr-like enzyme with NAD(P)H-hydrate dehydratase domain